MLSPASRGHFPRRGTCPLHRTRSEPRGPPRPSLCGGGTLRWCLVEARRASPSRRPSADPCPRRLGLHVAALAGVGRKPSLSGTTMTVWACSGERLLRRFRPLPQGQPSVLSFCSRRARLSPSGWCLMVMLPRPPCVATPAGSPWQFHPAAQHRVRWTLTFMARSKLGPAASRTHSDLGVLCLSWCMTRQLHVFITVTQ